MGGLRRLRKQWRAAPADARLLCWVLAAAVAGMGCCGVSVILLFAWAAAGPPWLLAAAHWLNWCAYAFLVVVVVLGVLLGCRVRRLPPG